MKVVEFSGTIKDGVVKIPKKILSNLSGEPVRIVIFVKEQKLAKKGLSLKSRFKSVKLDTRGFKFDRDEANE